VANSAGAGGGLRGSGYFSAFAVCWRNCSDGGSRQRARGSPITAGRAFAALAPFTIGVLAKEHSIGWALGFTAIFSWSRGVDRVPAGSQRSAVGGVMGGRARKWIALRPTPHNGCDAAGD